MFLKKSAKALATACLVSILGCGQDGSTTTETKVESTPVTVLKPAAPDEKPAEKSTGEKPSDAKKTSPAPAEKSDPKGSDEAKKDKPVSLDSPSSSPADGSSSKISLTTVDYHGFLKNIAQNRTAKLTMVDAWATWCGPCKENFPHVVMMHKKYAGRGLAVASLSLDDASKPQKIAEATKFLESQNAAFPNYVMTEKLEDACEKLNINGIPAVFVFGPDGKEIKRYTMDDPNHQFTYDQVEKEIDALLKAAEKTN